MNITDKKKVVTFEMLEDWHRCRHKALLRRLGRRGKISLDERIARTVGKAVENAVAAETHEEREAAIDDLVKRLPREEQADALKRVDELVARADELYDDSEESDQQVQFSWTDPVTGWTLVAKPDEVKYVQDDDGRGVKQIIDDKTSWRLTAKHKRNIFFFGLVVSLSDEEEEARLRKQGERPTRFPLQLVVRLLGTPPVDPETGEQPEMGEREHKFWYSRGRQQEKLDEIRRAIREMDAAFAEITKAQAEFEGHENVRAEVATKLLPIFPAKESWDCERCRYYRTDCPLFKDKVSSSEADSTQLPKTA